MKHRWEHQSNNERIEIVRHSRKDYVNCYDFANLFTTIEHLVPDRFARTANNYELVMTAARHYWNAAIPLVSQPIERELLKEPFKIILECIVATADKKVKKEVSMLRTCKEWRKMNRSCSAAAKHFSLLSTTKTGW